MSAVGYARIRAVQLVLACGVAALLALAVWPASIAGWLAGAVALGIGFGAGRRAWRRALPRIDRRNVLILYFSDAPFYLLLIAIFLAKAFPIGAGRMALSALSHPEVSTALVLAVAGAWCGYDLAYLRGVVRHEGRHGPIRVKTFSSRSVTGQQGMLERVAVVTRACAPRGKVAIHGEIWDARSLDGRTIPAGAEVVVRDIDEMLLVVEPRDEDDTTGGPP